MSKDAHESFRPRIKSLILMLKKDKKKLMKKKNTRNSKVIKETSKHIKNSIIANLFYILFSCTLFISGMIYRMLIYYIQNEIFSDGWF